MDEVALYYDFLIDEGQDPTRDPKPLKDYMDKWDGQKFIDKMHLNKSKSVLEIGVGTGRLAVRVAPYCKEFTGVDISEKTINQARKNIRMSFLKKPELIVADFLNYDFNKTFDIIYSSLTFLHFKDKQKAFEIVFNLLKYNGLFVLSTDKNQDEWLDFGCSKIKVYPDNPSDIKNYAMNSSFILSEEYETEFANIFIFTK